MDCPFCKIASKEIPAEIIYEDDENIAFLDIHPMTPGHAVVIPKIHADNIIELSESATSSLFIAVKKVASLLKERLESLGFTIGINHGSLSGQTVDHIHVHVAPRYTGDGGKSIHSVAHLSSNEPLSKIREKIIGG